MGRRRKPRAIDLYSGVGGWSLGLRLSGINVVASYEYWGPANETNFKNNNHQAQTVNIRRLLLKDLPEDIDIVVGSPPCTQFSFSNRGGGGDIADGLEDIKKFLSIVDHLKPRVWAMENVPRIANIIETEFAKGGALEEFDHLGCKIHIVDMAQYGLPQRRRRCIAGNYDVKLLESFRKTATPFTLGEVINALAADPVVDPLFGVSLSSADLTDHIEEDVLSQEEARVNRANKTTHTVYNSMPFPDPVDRAVRTITATCTRVSRESIVIPATSPKESYRRLTLRERASLQGFPVTFQFYGASYTQKLRMIGNALPPAFAYLMGHVLQDHKAENVPPLLKKSCELTHTMPPPVATPPDRVGAKYRPDRNFRFAIPSLRLKSGVRFELRNDHSGPDVNWLVAFFFGTSKDIQSLKLDSILAKNLTRHMSRKLSASISPQLDKLASYVTAADIGNMQAVWAHQGPGGTRPFMLLDKIDETGTALIKLLGNFEDEAQSLINITLRNQHGEQFEELPGVPKLRRNYALILAGLLVGSKINPLMAQGKSLRRRTARTHSA